MSDVVIEAESLGKEYRIGALLPGHRSLRETIVDGVSATARRLTFRRASRSPSSSGTIWALKDVNFQVRRGEVVGLIGRNGAGKSTLLKILSRITEPTTGQAVIHGRVGSLLEVGMGFHHELTGRENIFLNGAILGMKRAETLRNFDEIVTFAELERFIDTPVKFYSTGMYLRLAFGVAAHLESEILLVDEVLAVGDVLFQKKCLGKIGEIAKGGRTVFFVSHNMSAVQSLCSRGICLKPGGVAADGTVESAVNAYLETITDAQLANTALHEAPRKEGLGTRFRILSVRFEGVQDSQIPLWSPLRLRFDFETSEPVSAVSLGFSVYSMDREHLFTCEAADSDSLLELDGGTAGSAVGVVPHPNLAPARYVVDIRARSGSVAVDGIDSALMFEISPFGVSPWSTDRRFRPVSEWMYELPADRIVAEPLRPALSDQT